MLDHAAISGQAAPGIYSQTYNFENFYIVISLSGSEDEVTKELGRNNLVKIEENIRQTPTLTAQELVEMQKEQFSNGIKLSILAAKIEGQKLTLAGIGEIGGKIVRQGKIINLLAGVDQTIKNISGPLLHNDLLLLGTQVFFDQIVISELSSSSEVSLEDLKENFLPKMETAENEGQIAALLIKVDLTKNEESEEENSGEQNVNPLPESAAPVPPASERPTGDSPFKILAKISSPGGRKLFSQAEIRAKVLDGQYRKYFYLAIVVFITLIALLAYQLRSRSLEVSSQNLQSIQKHADDGLAAAAKLQGLNDQIARQMLSQTRSDVNGEIVKDFGADWQKNKSPQTQKLMAVLAKIDAQIATTSHIFHVDQWTPFYDFSLLKAEPKIVSAAAHSGQIIALDGANGAIYSLATQSKAGTIVTGTGSLKNGQYIDFTPDRAFVWASNGVGQKKLGDDSAGSLVIKASDKWGQIKKMAVYGGNIYLLDSQNNQIWKYQGTTNGFADISTYLNSDLKEDFSQSVDLAIDGYVYVLLTDGTILRFGGGGPTDFSLSGLVDPLQSADGIFASDDTQNIYLLDLKGNKIVVIDKKGNYQAEYLLPAANNTSTSLSASQLPATLLADESIKKIFLVSGATVFGIDIQQ